MTKFGNLIQNIHKKYPILVILEKLVIFTTLLAFLISILDRKDERVARAWQLLTTKSTGNSGKIGALETLADYGVSLVGMDLSCATNDGFDKDSEGTTYCARGVFLEGIDLSPRIKWLGFSTRNPPFSWIPSFRRGESIFVRRVDLSDSNLSGVKMENAALNGTILSFVKLSNAEMDHVSFEGAQLHGTELRQAFISDGSFKSTNIHAANFTGAMLAGTDFTRARITESYFIGSIMNMVDLSEAQLVRSHLRQVSMFDARLVDTEISDSTFGVSNTLDNMFDNSWAWNDGVPRIGSGETKIWLCDPEENRKRWKKGVGNIHYLKNQRKSKLKCSNSKVKELTK